MLANSHNWVSSNLSKEMNLSVYGHFGFAILLFPAFTDSHEEYFRESLIESIAPYVEKGKFKVYAVDTVNKESWFNEDIPQEQKSKRHFQYNNYLIEEVVPFIFGDCGGAVPIITCGASLGGFHAANSYFRRPDIFYGMISLSSTFNIEHFTKGYFDDNCYFNSPVHYLPNLNEDFWLSALRSKHHVYLLSGSGENEFPHNSSQMSEVLRSKGIPHMLDIWGPEWGHNYDTWKKMLINLFETKL